MKERFQVRPRPYGLHPFIVWDERLKALARSAFSRKQAEEQAKTLNAEDNVVSRKTPAEHPKTKKGQDGV